MGEGVNGIAETALAEPKATERKEKKKGTRMDRIIMDWGIWNVSMVILSIALVLLWGFPNRIGILGAAVIGIAIALVIARRI